MRLERQCNKKYLKKINIVKVINQRKLEFEKLKKQLFEPCDRFIQLIKKL